jgi:two-component system heavy metal sensor histidine kinase CusS
VIWRSRARSVRVSLALWFTLALAGGLLLFAAGVWMLLRYSLVQDLEQSTAARLESVSRFLDAEWNAPDFDDEWREYAQAIPSGVLVAIRDRAGHEVAVHPPALSGYKTDSGNTTWRGERYFWRTDEHTAGTQSYVVTVASSLTLAEALSSRLLWLFAAASPVILVLAGIGGYWMSRRALVPVARLTQQAETLSLDNLSLRLEVVPTGDELQALAETWNRMLGRLQSAVSRLSEFTADASHELRTPLALIRTTAELALRRPRSAEEYRSALETIARESERTTQVIEDLLALARADAGRGALPLVPLDFTDAIADIGSEYRNIASLHNIEFRLHSTAGLMVNGNRAALRRIAAILLDNAFKYTPPGGTVTVSIAQDASRAVLEVSDTGVGIPADVLPRIFERFYRADPARNYATGGHGLGLSIAEWIARAHQGVITVASEPGRGSTFRFTLPLLRMDSSGDNPSQSAALADSRDSESSRTGRMTNQQTTATP